MDQLPPSFVAMADLKLSKAQQKWLPWVERNLVYDKSKAWFGLRQGKDEAVRDGGTSNTVFRGVRLINKTGYEWIDQMWVGSTDPFKIWARGKWRDDCLEEEQDLRRSWSASSQLTVQDGGNGSVQVAS